MRASAALIEPEHTFGVAYALANGTTRNLLKETVRLELLKRNMIHMRWIVGLLTGHCILMKHLPNTR